MRKLQNYRRLLGLTVALASCLLAANPCLAKKGGNGNGGGDPPAPSAPVSYKVTPIAIPGSSLNVFGHNNDAAIVGTLFDAAPGGRRALAYLPALPDVLPNTAFYLDDPALGVVGIPSGWHTRSAVDVNKFGTIVGNLELDSAPDTDIKPFYLTGITTGSPILHHIEKQNPNAWHEVASSINDSGDMVIWSQERLADGSSIDSLYYGNPGLHGEQVVPFVKVDFASQGFLSPRFSNDSLSLSNRIGGSTTILAGQLTNDGENYTFRTALDGSEIELAPDYTAEDGSQYSWGLNYGNLDMNASGDITGGAGAHPAKKGKIKFNLYAGLWEYGSEEILPVGNFDPFESEWWGAALNDDGDFLLKAGQGRDPALWHGVWSETNGELDIASLIDPNDPNRDLYSNVFDLTNRDADDWPTIIAQGSEVVGETNQPYWLLLTPQSTAEAPFAAHSVPEPSSVALLGLAFATMLRRHGRRHP